MNKNFVGLVGWLAIYGHKNEIFFFKSTVMKNTRDPFNSMSYSLPLFPATERHEMKYSSSISYR